MKQVILLLIISLNIECAFCQEIDKGIDNNPILNSAESVYLNEFLKNQRMDFDFKEKKTAFVSLDIGINLRSKNDYFEYYYKRNESANSYSVKMITLVSNQKQESNGYDVLVLMDTQKKKINEKLIDKIINKLSQCENAKYSDLYQLGLDENPVLTKPESDYFNIEFNPYKTNYDFANLKIGFFNGNYGRNIQTKKDYFDLVKNRLGNFESASMDYLIKLTKEEKIESGGYDFIIVSWSKILPSNNETMIKQLKDNE